MDVGTRKPRPFRQPRRCLVRAHHAMRSVEQPLLLLPRDSRVSSEILPSYASAMSWLTFAAQTAAADMADILYESAHRKEWYSAPVFLASRMTKTVMARLLVGQSPTARRVPYS